MNQQGSPENRNPTSGSRTYSSKEGAPIRGEEAPSGLNDYTELTDQRLVQEIALGDRNALEELYRRFGNAVFSLSVHMLRDPGAAEEVTQDAFFKVWRRASSYRPDRGKVTAWLFSIAHHRVIDEVRKRRRRDQTLVLQDVGEIPQPVNETGDPAKHASQQSWRQEIGGALSTLRPEQREVVVLAYYGGFTHSEIAARLDQPLGTVKTRMRLALRKLREVMAPQSQEWKEHGL